MSETADRPEGVLHETATLHHRGVEYAIAQLRPRVWKITAEGRTFGTVEQLSPEGESGEPVYRSVLPGEQAPYREGNDWDALIRASINEVHSH